MEMIGKKLTLRQKEILKFIADFIENNKFPPTRAELSRSEEHTSELQSH